MSKAVIQPFAEYQKSRVIFVQTVAELANREANIEPLRSVDVMNLVGPLLADPVASIQQSAALAIGRLSKHSKELASQVISEKSKILSMLINPDASNNKFYKKSACYVLSQVSRHGPEWAEKVASVGAIKYLVECLSEYDPSVKRAAAWALGHIAKHNKELASKVEKEGAIDVLIMCLQEPEIEIKKNSIQTLSYIASHSEDLANAVARVENISIISYYLGLKDISLKRQICVCLCNIAKHGDSLSNSISQQLTSYFEILKACVTSDDETLRKNVIQLLNELAKKSDIQAALIQTKISNEVLINYVKNHPGESRIFGLTLLSTIAGFNETLAGGILDAKEVKILDTLKETLRENSTIVQSAACLTIANLSKHTPDLTKKLVIEERDKKMERNNIPVELLNIYLTSKDELKMNARNALVNIIDKCDQIDVLDPLLSRPRGEKMVYNPDHEGIIKKVLDKMGVLIKENPSLKKDFTNTLKKIQTLKKTFKNNLNEEIHSINTNFPEQIINYFSEDYEKKIIEEWIKKNDQNN